MNASSVSARKSFLSPIFRRFSTSFSGMEGASSKARNPHRTTGERRSPLPKSQRPRQSDLTLSSTDVHGERLFPSRRPKLQQFFPRKLQPRHSLQSSSHSNQIEHSVEKKLHSGKEILSNIEQNKSGDEIQNNDIQSSSNQCLASSTSKNGVSPVEVCEKSENCLDVTSKIMSPHTQTLQSDGLNSDQSKHTHSHLSVARRRYANVNETHSSKISPRTKSKTMVTGKIWNNACRRAFYPQDATEEVNDLISTMSNSAFSSTKMSQSAFDCSLKRDGLYSNGSGVDHVIDNKAQSPQYSPHLGMKGRMDKGKTWKPGSMDKDKAQFNSIQNYSRSRVAGTYKDGTSDLYDSNRCDTLTRLTIIDKGENIRDGKLTLQHPEYSPETFDICPPRGNNHVKLNASLFIKNKELRKQREVEKIIVMRPGMILMKNFIAFHDQVDIVKKCRELGNGSGGFYRPGYADGAKLRLWMMCMGKNWDPETSLYGDKRLIDGAKPPAIPAEFSKLVERAIQDAHNYMKNSNFRRVETFLPNMQPDICISNFYTETGKLGLHKDRDESQESLRRGLPVVSFSFGESAEFLYGDSRDLDSAEKVILESGDVLIFGGKSRHIFHGVSRIIPKTAPKFLVAETGLRPGRLNLTFRQY